MSLGAPFPDALLEIPPSGLVDLRPLAGRTATQEQPHGAIPSSLCSPSVAWWRRAFRSPRTHGEASSRYCCVLARGIVDLSFLESCHPGRLHQTGLPADKGPVEVLMHFCVPYRMQSPEI